MPRKATIYIATASAFDANVRRWWEVRNDYSDVPATSEDHSR
jgi:hypothetical protein